MRFDSGYFLKPAVLSILFHLFVVTATMISWPFLVKPAPTAQPLVIVDIVKLAPKTNLSASQVRQKLVQNLNKKRHGVNPRPRRRQHRQLKQRHQIRMNQRLRQSRRPKTLKYFPKSQRPSRSPI